MSKIYIRTYAYNSEKTLRRAVDSVLSQTWKNFEYYLCDNGSTDNTGKIIEEYAKNDSRIKAFHNHKNRNFMETEECLLLPYNIPENDFFCALDADDAYDAAFFEEMLSFMDKYELDVAACGSDFLDVADNDSLIRQRLLQENLILEGKGFAEQFLFYFEFTRTTWGKLFKGAVSKHLIQERETAGFPRAYGGDTYNVLRAFTAANRVGVLAKSLHKYYVSKRSVSYSYDPERVAADRILHKAAFDYLSPYGNIMRRENEDYLFLIYLYALSDTFSVISNSNLFVSEKIKELEEMLYCEYTKQLIGKEDLGISCGEEALYQGERREFFKGISVWLSHLNNRVGKEQIAKYCEMGELCSAAANDAENWIFFKKVYLKFLITEKNMEEANGRLTELEELLPEHRDILTFRKEINKITKKLKR